MLISVARHFDRVKCYSRSQGTNVKIIWKVLLQSLWYDASCTAKEPTGSVAVYGQGKLRKHLKISINFLMKILTRVVASLTVSGGQEFHFPYFFLKFRSTFLIFPQTLFIFFLILAFRVGESPTREGSGYGTDLDIRGPPFSLE